MNGLLVVVILGSAILVAGILAKQARLPSPVVAIAVGAIIGLVPAVSEIVVIPPQILLTVFVPALLYWESLNTSLREIRRNWLAIFSLAVGLVLATAGIVAVIAHAFELTWPSSLLLGAVLAPTDATAVAFVLRRLPRRLRAVLRVESLINDGTALVLYGVAIAAIAGSASFSVGTIAVDFVYSYLAAIVIGIVVGLLAVLARLTIRGDRLLNSTISVVTPFVGFFIAEQVHVSGVVAVVTTGLLLSQIGPHVITASMRSQSFGFWQLTTFLLSSTLFVLIGIQTAVAFDKSSTSAMTGVVVGLACAGALIVLRVLWVSLTPFSRRGRVGRQRAQPVTIRQRLPLGWAGFRGAVSLAAALSIPVGGADAIPAADRDTIIGATIAVILVNLVVLGPTFPGIIRAARFPRDDTERQEDLLAQKTTVEAALDALPGAAKELGTRPEAYNDLESRMHQVLAGIRRQQDAPAARDSGTALDEEHALELSVIPAQRRALFALRRRRVIDDVILRRQQSRLDRNELRLSDEADGADDG